MPDPDRIRLLMELYQELERLERQFGTEQLRGRRQQLENIIAKEMDPKECGSTLWLRPLYSGTGLLRVSSYPDETGHARITHATYEPPEIDYGWVENNQIRRRLTSDYYAMRFAAVVSVNEGADTRKRFLDCCLYAQYQLEPLLRYYFQEKGEWKRLQWETDKGEIRDPSYYKLQKEFGKRYYRYSIQKGPMAGEIIPDFSNRHYSTLNTLRLIRNYALHRLLLPDNQDEKKKAEQAMNVWVNMRYGMKFFNERVEQGLILDAFDKLDFDRVYLTLADVAKKIRADLGP